MSQEHLLARHRLEAVPYSSSANLSPLHLSPNGVTFKHGEIVHTERINHIATVSLPGRILARAIGQMAKVSHRLSRTAACESKDISAHSQICLSNVSI